MVLAPAPGRHRRHRAPRSCGRRGTTSVLIKRFLDTGVQTLLIPYVQNEEEARKAVAATRYPPARHSRLRRHRRAPRGYGRVKDYLKPLRRGDLRAGAGRDARALDNLEAIATVEGVDGVFIGPTTSPPSFGQIGNWGHPEVQAALEDAVRRLRKINKPAGILTPNEEEAKRFIAWGYTFVAVGADLGLLARNADALAKRFKGG